MSGFLHEPHRPDRDDDPTLDSWEDDRAAGEPADDHHPAEYEVTE